MAEVSEKLVGNLLLLTRHKSKRGRIYSLVVDPAARGLGVARQLVQQAETMARHRRCDELSLEVRSDNQAARALYA